MSGIGRVQCVPGRWSENVCVVDRQGALYVVVYVCGGLCMCRCTVCGGLRLWWSMYV